MIPVRKEGQEMILLRDPEGIFKEQLLISRELAFLLLLMDGSHSLRDIQVEYMRSFGELLFMDRLEELVLRLDERYLLQSPRYEKRIEELKKDYVLLTKRPAILAGESYPAQKEELLSFFATLFSYDEGRERVYQQIRGILTPHIDYQRGKDVYPTVYHPLKNSEVKLIVIFGTSHKPLDRMWAISLKDFESPLGEAKVPDELKEIIVCSHLGRYVDEWPHRFEHSIELQIPLLKYFLNKDVYILPILTGQMEDFVAGRRKENDQELTDLVSSLIDCLKKCGEHYIVMSAADLAHIGLQFGDPYPLDDLVLERSRRRDEMLLDRIRSCDASGFLELIREENDCRRICGLAPIYFQLRLLQGLKCDLLTYRQWTDGMSSVSFAGGVFYS